MHQPGPKPRSKTKPTTHSTPKRKSEPKPKVKPEPKSAARLRARDGGKTAQVTKMRRKAREASPSPAPEREQEYAEPRAEHGDELDFALPAHRLFVGRAARSPFLFDTEGPWSVENLAWIEGRDLEEVRPPKWEPQYWR